MIHRPTRSATTSTHHLKGNTLKKFPAALAAAALVSVGLGVAAPAHAVTPLTTPTGVTVTDVEASYVSLELTDPNLATPGADDDYIVTVTNSSDSGESDTIETSGYLDGNGANVVEVDVPIYELDIDALAGKQYQVTVVATDNNEVLPDSAATTPVTFTAVGPYVQTPEDLSLSGSWTVGGTLTAAATPYPGDTDAGTWTAGASVSYQWILDPKDTYSATTGYKYFDGTVFATTTTPSVVLPASALGHVIGVRAVGHEAGYQDGQLNNNYWSLHTVTAGTLEMGTPKVKGKAKVGKKVKVSTGTWTAGTTFSYKWLANGKPVKGKKGKKAALKLTQSLKGQKISVQVTAHAPAGYTPAVVKSGTVVTTKAKKVK